MALGLTVILLLLLLHSFLLVVQLPPSHPQQHGGAGIFLALPFLPRRRRPEYDDAFSNSDIQDDDVSNHESGMEEGERSSVGVGRNQRPSLLLLELDEQQLLDQLTQWEGMIARNLSAAAAATALKHVASCRTIDCGNLQERQNNYTVVFYNPLDDQARFVCGRKLEPHSMMVVKSTDPCSTQQQPYTQSTLFPVLPTRHNQQQLLPKKNHSSFSLLPPIRLGIKGVTPSRSVRFAKFRACDVSCYFLPNHLNMPTIARTVEGTPWEIATSMEGPVYYKSLRLMPPSPPPPDNNNNKDATTNIVAAAGSQQPTNRFYATTSFDSDIPLPYFSWDEYSPNHTVTVQGVDYTRAIKGAVFMAHNCRSTNQREALVQSLIELSSRQRTSNNNTSSFTLRVDSISRCLHNHDPPPTAHKDDKSEIMGQYLFYLALENQNADDYITEKLWGSLFGSGTVPIYFGAPNIHKHVPPHSIIHVRDFPNVPALWNYLVKVANNRTLYESYHAWRKQPLPEAFVKKYNFTHTHSLCRMCRWAFAKRYGWGWNHAPQTIDEEDGLLQHRKLCWDDSTGLLIHPFREQWQHSSFRTMVLDKEHTMCKTNQQTKGYRECVRHDPPLGSRNTFCEDANSTIPIRTRSVTMANGSLRRTVWSHDGFVDMFLEPIHRAVSSNSSSTSLILEIQLPLLKDDAASPENDVAWNVFSHNQFWLQKGNIRLTVLTNRAVVLARPSTGMVQVFFSLQDQKAMTARSGNARGGFDETFRMRFFVEQVDPVRKEGRETGYFASLMAEDFFIPVEKFLVLDNTES